MRHPILLALFALSLPAPLAAHAADGPVRIVCLGDSVTKAVRPGVLPEETFCAVLEKHLVGKARNATVFNSGIGGNTTGDGLKRFAADVLEHQPNYVVLMFGLNDSWIDAGKTSSRLTVEQYRANLEEMIGKLSNRDIKVVLMTPNPAIPPKYEPERNATLKPYVEAVRELAAKHDLPLVDVYRHFAELALEVDDINAYFTDAMHPNPAGQKQIADLLFARFSQELAGSSD